MNEIQEAEIDRKAFLELTDTLEQATSIAKAAKFGMATTYVKGLTPDEIEHIFDGIVELIEPVKNILYDINENIDFNSKEKVVIR